MRAVIPLGRSRPSTLPYAIRSLAQYADVDELITVGEKPEGIDPDLHIPSPNDQKPHLNILGHLERVCERLDGEWIWTDDDVFTVKPWQPGVYVRNYSIARHLRDYPTRGHYSKAVRASVALIQSDGLDPEEVACGPCHRPWLVNTERVRKTVEAVQPVGGSFKTYYVAGLDDVIRVGDAKVTGRGMPKPSADVISVFNDSWRYNAGRIIRERFGERSRWESAPNTDTARPVRGQPRGPRRRHRR